LFRLVIIKEVKGGQVVTPLQSSVRDKLAYADKYEDEEEEALDKLVDYFQRKAWLSQDTNIYFHLSHDNKSVQVSTKRRCCLYIYIRAYIYVCIPMDCSQRSGSFKG
jgi:hypothetical protein